MVTCAARVKAEIEDLVAGRWRPVGGGTSRFPAQSAILICSAASSKPSSFALKVLTATAIQLLDSIFAVPYLPRQTALRLSDFSKPTMVESLPPCEQPVLTPEYHDVVIVGAGISGICMACQLKRKFNIHDIKILERSEDPAGTWTNNTYPGCACDVPAPVYSFSFATRATGRRSTRSRRNSSTTWHGCAEHDLQKNFHFQTTVQEARYDGETGLWHVWSQDWRKDGTDGEKHHFVCKFFVSAVGGLSQPKACDIEGNETFEGPIFHTAKWDHSVSLDGKDVVLIGNGCSATQCVVPGRALQVAHAVHPLQALDCTASAQPVRRHPGLQVAVAKVGVCAQAAASAHLARSRVALYPHPSEPAGPASAGTGGASARRT